MTATKTNERPGTARRPPLQRDVGVQGAPGARPDPRRGRPARRRDPDRHRARGGRGHRQGPRLGRGQRGAQRPAEPRRPLRLGLLRRRGRHHEALAPPGAGPGHADPQADLPHHHHREPPPGRAARAARAAARRPSAPTAPAGWTPRAGAPTSRAGCRAVGPPRRRPRPTRPRRRPRPPRPTRPTRTHPPTARAPRPK